MNIIGFSARKQGGKSTAAMFLWRKLCHEKQVWISPFAAGLKGVVELLFLQCAGIICVPTDWERDDFKNTVHPCGLTYRELLQKTGTDFARGIWPDVWVTHWRHGLPRDDSLVLVPDVRFPNEVRAIQDMGGHVVRLLRAPFPDDEHESETALDGNICEASTILRRRYHHATTVHDVPITLKNGTEIVFDAILDNRKMTIEQQNEATWKLVTERGWLEDSLADTEAYLKMQEKRE